MPVGVNIMQTVKQRSPVVGTITSTLGQRASRTNSSGFS